MNMDIKILILSDTHKNKARLSRVLALHRDADAIIHLGDGYGDFSGLDIGGIPLYRVRGNCDEETNDFGVLSDEEILDIEGVRILMTHGHHLGVKFGLTKAASYAVSKGADILLYGHTHVPREVYLGAGDRVGVHMLQKPLWIFNPGSLGSPREGKKPSFGLLTIREGQILLSHGETDY